MAVPRRCVQWNSCGRASAGCACSELDPRSPRCVSSLLQWPPYARRAGWAAGRQLTWFDRRGTVVWHDRAGETGPFAGPELAPDGERVAIGRGVAGNIDVWLMEAATEVWSRFTFRPSAENSPVWSPDGSRFVFASNGDRPDGQFTQIVEKPSDGSGDERPRVRRIRLRCGQSIGLGTAMRSFTAIGSETDGDLWDVVTDRRPDAVPVVQTRFLEDEEFLRMGGGCFRINQ